MKNPANSIDNQPKSQQYDVAIIGAGLGGLLCARILGMEGYRVVVLEKNKQIGGNLQIFVRDKCILDTGVHYLGGLDIGQNLYRYFQYFGIMDQLELKRMDIGFDRITFEGDEKEYKLAQGYTHFEAILCEYFPDETEAIHTYCEKLKEVCNHFSLYNVEKGAERSIDSSFMQQSARNFIHSITKNKKLRNILAGNSFLYAGKGDKTPLYVHAISIDPYIRSAWKCVDGGAQIARILAKQIKRGGGKLLRRTAAKRFLFEDKKITAIETADGRLVQAKRFISAIHPSQTLDLVGEGNIRPAFYKRIKKLDNGPSVFSVHLIFKPKSFPYLNYNCYHYKTNDVWDASNYNESDWPKSYMISIPAHSKSSEWAESMTIMTYMSFEAVEKWKDSHNTVKNPTDRGDAYEKFKQEKAAVLIDEVSKKFPKINEKIKAVYTSSPLSYRDYIGTEDGAMYGIEKDCKSPEKSYISPRTKIANLLLTGQNLNMHGIVGVTISAVVTCNEILGQDYLINKIHEKETTL